MLAIASGISGALGSFLGVSTAKIISGTLIASEHLATTIIILVVAFSTVGQFVFVPILQRKVLQLSQSGSSATPPINAEFLLYLFMSPENCDAFVGDLEERYRLIKCKFGARRANIWYRTQAIRSVWPIAWAWAKKATLKPALRISSGIARIVVATLMRPSRLVWLCRQMSNTNRNKTVSTTSNESIASQISLMIMSSSVWAVVLMPL
jgi:hypothetical protein